MKIDPGNLDWWASHELMVSCVVPRPIAFVSTISEDGVFNLAPYSFFAAVAAKPMLLGFSTGWKKNGKKKDTLKNIEFAKEFVINVVTEELAKPMNQSSANYPSYVSEFEEVGLTPVMADLVKAPRLAEAPVNMECRLVQILEFGNLPKRTSFIIGEVLRVHVRDELWVSDQIQVSPLPVVARMGGEIYCRATDIFEMKRPERLT